MRILPKKTWQKALLFLFVFFLLLAATDQYCVWYGRQITISRATTYITSPIVDGYPDYLAALNASLSKDVTPANNAAPLILKLVGTGDAPAAAVNAIYKTWGLPVPTAPPLFIDYPAWVKKQPATQPAIPTADDDALQDEVTNTFEKPRSTPDNPQLDRWLQASAPALDIFQQATRRSQFFIPVVTDAGLTASIGADSLLNDQRFGGRFRELANAALARAMIRLKHHDQTGFEHDTLASVRFAHLVAHQPSTIESLVALALGGTAMQALQHAAATNLLDAAHIRSIMEELDAAAPLANFSTGLNNFERYNTLDDICTFRRNGIGPVAGDDAATISNSLGIVPVNYNSGLRQANKFYDCAVAACDLPTYAQREKAFNDIDRACAAATPKSDIDRALHPLKTVLEMLLPDFKRFSEIQTRYLVERDLAITALQLRLHKLATGSFPDSLADLKSLTFTPPRDRFTDAPLIYRKKAAGYILYSLGENLKDDGGTPRSPKNRKNYDLVIQAPQ